MPAAWQAGRLYMLILDTEILCSTPINPGIYAGGLEVGDSRTLAQFRPPLRAERLPEVRVVPHVRESKIKK